MKKLFTIFVLVMASMVVVNVTNAQSVDLSVLDGAYLVDTAKKVRIYPIYINSTQRESRKYFSIQINSEVYTQVFFPESSGKIIFELNQPMTVDVQIKKIEQELTSLFKKQNVKFKKIYFYIKNSQTESLVIVF